MCEQAKTWRRSLSTACFTNIQNPLLNHIFRCLNIDFICHSRVDPASIHDCYRPPDIR